MSSDSHRKRRRTGWQRLRVYFRRCRITVLVLLLVLVCAGAYLNQIGLPGFVKRPVLENLRARGVDVQFSRLRLRWYRGIVADDVRVVGTNATTLPRFSARSADVQLDYAALVHLKAEVRGITLRGGNVVWNLGGTNEPARELSLTNLTGTLRFLPDDEWRLDHLQADFAGAHFQATGQIFNASALREWPVFHGQGKRPSRGAAARLRAFHDLLQQIHFIRPPEFELRLTGDAKDPESFGGALSLNAAGALTPWGELQNGVLLAQLLPAQTNAPHAAELSLVAERASTRWAALRNLNFDLNVARFMDDTNRLRCWCTLQAGEVKTEWASAGSLRAHADWIQSQTNAVPVAGEIDLHGENMTSRWAKTGSGSAVVHFRPASNNIPPDPALGPWSKLLPYALEVTAALTNATVHDIALPQLGVALQWEAPGVTLSNLQVRLPQGGFAARATANVQSRRLEFAGQTHFDLRQLDPVLTEKSRAWLDHFTLHQPPALELAGHLTLPAWTNRTPDWRGEVQPGIVLAGSVQVTNAAYRGISALTAVTHLTYSNRVWHLPDLALTRPEGTLLVNLQSDEISHDFNIKLRGPFDPRLLQDQLGEKGRRGLAYLEYTTAPQLDVEVLGRWYDHDRLAARGQVTWTNFSFRAQHADWLEASLDYTNKVLNVIHPLVRRGTERAEADGLRFDFANNRAYLTNGFSDTDPMVIATAIGPKTAAAVEHYQFLKPPVARVHGVIPLKGEADADLHFDLEGGPFRWLRFNLPHIAGHIDWAHESVTLTNITAAFYGGQARGDAWFDVHEHDRTPFRFAVAITNTDLHALMVDLHSPTNRLEGALSGTLVITNAETHDFHSWNGHGEASLLNGLIWDTPVFGIMSSVMNSVVPGIGNSRASEARGTYTITNSVIYTKDLDIRASAMRLQYAGTVDFGMRIDARVQAELLRDTWFFGRLMSTALWPVSKLFEYRVTGTLANPKAEPIYFLPRMFLAPLHPMKSLKEMMQEPNSDTNAPVFEPLEP
ncbi:MAG TPA: AsmA-like C-terminal region-containing protein [Verrucomicrobiae bacterium]|nr:AsmA-like C-terminal region-containing protein [Verrucomicrobiae bacterium]